MKRWLGILLAALLLLPLLPARGEEIETIPEEILAWMEAEGIPQQEREHLLFSLPDGTQQMVWIIWQRDLVVWEKTDVGWIRTGEWSTDLYPVSLRQQNPDDLLPDGSHASDDLGFRVSSSDGQEFMHFRWEAGQGFVISGWCKQGYDGEVMVQDGIASYYPAGSTEPEAQVDLSGMLTQTYSIEQLPATPQEATARAAITEQALAGYFPGYTLRDYSALRNQEYTQVAYSRVENGLLYIKWAEFWAGREEPQVVDCMPVPLSPELLSRLETEEFDTLVQCTQYSSLFWTEDGVDVARLPVEGKVIESALKTQSLMLLTEDEAGLRRLWEVTLQEDGYAARSTVPLPAGVWMDTPHDAGTDLSLKWYDGEQGNGKERYATYKQYADGVWRLSYEDLEGAFVHAAFAWIEVDLPNLEQRRYIGTLQNSELFASNPAQLPDSVEALPAAMDKTGWAVVNNPNPADRLHLRVSPERGAASLGKFYNGTPVRVLEERGDWVQVEIGLDGNLTGWMMKEYLAYGEAMDQVQPAWLEKFYRQESGPQLLYPSAKEENPQVLDTGSFQVVGVVEDDWYILLSDWGQTGYVPQSWLFDGNG